jgi:hypothetical protein
MTDRMALAELLEKGSDRDLLGEMIGFVAQRLFPAFHGDGPRAGAIIGALGGRAVPARRHRGRQKGKAVRGLPTIPDPR